MNITQHAFNDLLVFDLGIFGSLLKNAYLNDVQKMFYSAATFNPTFPNHKNMETGSWDQITNASQITNPLAWLEVKDDDSNAHINTHLKLVFNLSKHLMFTAFGSYTYNVIDNAQYLPTSVWAAWAGLFGGSGKQNLYWEISCWPIKKTLVCIN